VNFLSVVVPFDLLTVPSCFKTVHK